MANTIRVEWPKYVKTHEKYHDGIYLINNRDELKTLALTLARHWRDASYLPELDWYETTYESYFEKEVGMKVDSFEIIRHMPLLEHSPLKEIFAAAYKAKKDWLEYKEGIDDLKLFLKILDGIAEGNKKIFKDNINAFYTYMNTLSWNGKRMFEVIDFDKV